MDGGWAVEAKKVFEVSGAQWKAVGAGLSRMGSHGKEFPRSGSHSSSRVLYPSALAFPDWEYASY
jgi:hypothetical protein